MRILFISIPSLGHVRAVVPVAKVLTSRGHEVHWILGSSVDEYVSRSGACIATLLPKGLSQDVLEVPSLTSREIDLWFLESWAVPLAEQALGPAMDHARELDPDMIVTDATALWGPMVAEGLGKPWAAYCPSLFTSSPRRQIAIRELLWPQVPMTWTAAAAVASAHWKIERRLNRLRRRFGLPAVDNLSLTAGALVLCFTTRRIELDGAGLPRQARCVGPVFASPDDLDPFPDARPSLPDGTDPLVYLSLGNVNAGFVDVARAALEGLKALPVRVLVANPRGLDLGRFCPNRIRLENRSVSQTAILKHTAVVVGSGGFNTVQESLCHGVPIVSMPIAGDEPAMARCLEKLGLGRMIPEGELSSRAVMEAVTDVLRTPAIAERTRQFAAEARLSNAVRSAAHLIETLGRTGAVTRDPQQEQLDLLPVRPRFTPCIALVERGEGVVTLASALETYTFRHGPTVEAVRWLWSHLGGTRPVADVVAEWPNEGTVLPLILSLAERGLLCEGDLDMQPSSQSSSERYGPQLALFSYADAGRRAAGPPGAAFQEKLLNASVTTVGAGLLGSNLVRLLCTLGVGEIHVHCRGVVERQLVERGSWYEPQQVGQARGDALAARARALRPDLKLTVHELEDPSAESDSAHFELGEGCHLVVGALDAANPRLYGQIDAASLARHVPWTSIRRTGLCLEIGPTVVPGQTSCFYCYQQRRLAHEDLPGLQRSENSELNLPLGVDLLAVEIVKLLTGFGDPQTLGRFLVLDPFALTLSTHRVFRLPRCPRCRPKTGRPPEFAWRSEA